MLVTNQRQQSYAQLFNTLLSNSITCKQVYVIADCTCQNVMIWTQNQPTVAGTYYATSLWWGGKVVYKMHNTPLFLYYWNAEVQYWLIGNTLGVNRGGELGYLSNVTTSHNPQFANYWRYYNYTTQLWTDDNKLSISCTCKWLLLMLFARKILISSVNVFCTCK